MDFSLNLDADTVAEAMTADPICVAPETPVRTVFSLLKEHRTGSVLVCEADRLTGIFTERDALGLMARQADLDLPVEFFMTAKPVALNKHDTLAAAIRQMTEGGYRRLPIVDDRGRPIGLLKVTGIVNYLVEHFPQAVYNLPPDPMPVMQERDGA